MHNWRPCLKLRSAILIVLSTVVAKDANHRFQSLWWKKRDRIEGNREAFSSLETLGCVQRSLGCSHGDMSTEFGDEKTCFSPSAAGAGGFPRMVWDIRLGCRPSLSPAWRISPRSIILEDLESVSTTLFAAPAWIILFVCFLLSCPCVDLDKHSFFCRFTGTVWTRGTDSDTFSVLAHSFSPFVSHFDTHFYTSVTAPCSAGVHKATVLCMQKPRSQSSWLGLPLRSLCCAIHPLSRLHGALLRKPRNFILLASSNFILLHPGTQRHRVTPPIVRLTPLALSDKPSRASKPGWLTEKIKKKKEAHLAAMSKKAPACFAKSSGHVFNHPRREIELELKESVLGSDWTWKLLMASLATTVDNTIKMADTVRKHGCQWCIRSIHVYKVWLE